MNMKKEAILKKNEEQRLLQGHPWVFGNEILKVNGEPQPGDEVNVRASNGKFVGRGFYNPRSKITVRLFSRDESALDKELLRKRIEAAWNYRKKTVPTDNCRIVFAEADLLPALIVDRFTDDSSGRVYLILQTLALGMDKHKETIRDILLELFSPSGIYERNDVPVREKEGLGQLKGFLTDPFDTGIVIRENGILFHVDLAGGQKTGYFLDQRENRAAIASFCGGARVLNAFSHTGGFALNAVKHGAEAVSAVDISGDAIAMIRKNAELNGYGGKVDAFEANVFDYLRGCADRDDRFDLIVLDPPAFAKGRSTIAGAYRGYKEINLRAMKLIPPGGVLVSCSCSQAMDLQLFQKMVQEAAVDAKRVVRQIESRTQAKDHPILYGYDESFYLKCLILQIL